MPDYEGSNSSRSTGPYFSVPRMSRSSRSSSLPELSQFHPEPFISIPLQEHTQEEETPPEMTTQMNFSVSNSLPMAWKKHRQKYNIECCALPMCLVTLQILVGFTIMVVAITMLLMSPSIKDRDAPYWGGIWLFVTGTVGFYFNAIKDGMYEGNRRWVLIKGTFFSLSVACIFINSIASAFCIIQTRTVSAILSTDDCFVDESGCECKRKIEGDLTRPYKFLEVLNCQSFLINLRTYMYIQSSLNGVGALASFWTTLLMWRRRFAEFHSGLRFYSYSAALPNHPWSTSQQAPYANIVCVADNQATNQDTDDQNYVSEQPMLDSDGRVSTRRDR